MAKNSKTYVIWNENEYAALLRQVLGQNKVITNENDLLKNVGSINNLVILAELNWGSNRLSQFQGFEILRDLRAIHRLKCPVIISSFMPEKYFRQELKQNILFKLLKAPHHIFKQLPLDYKNVYFDGLNDISDELLDDIIESLCNLEGMLDEELHWLKNAVVTLPDEKNPELKIKQAVQRSFSRIKALFPYEASLDEIKEDLLKNLGERIFVQGSYSEAVKKIESYAELLRGNLIVKKESPVEKLPEKPKWEVLFIDDQEHIRKGVKKEFELRNIDCIAVESGESAFRVLEEDERSNWITVVIADYRLEYEDGNWQSLQGPSVLKEIFLHRPNLVTFFALTSANRRALLRIQKEYQMKVSPYFKSDVLSSEGGFNIFAQNVYEQGEKLYDAVCNQPTGSTWHTGHKAKFQFPLKVYYKHHRQFPDYAGEEEEICNKARIYVEKFMEAFESGTDPPSHNLKFQTELKEGPENPDRFPETLKRFRIKLVGRRIALALHLKAGLTRTAIYYALQTNPKVITGEDDVTEEIRISKKDELQARLNTIEVTANNHNIPESIFTRIQENINHLRALLELKKSDSKTSGKENVKEKDKINRRISQLINTHLALSLEEDIPNHLLPEEKFWLQHDMKINLV